MFNKRGYEIKGIYVAIIIAFLIVFITIVLMPHNARVSPIPIITIDGSIWTIVNDDAPPENEYFIGYWVYKNKPTVHVFRKINEMYFEYGDYGESLSMFNGAPIAWARLP
jgi:hypothetical protein